MSVEGKCMTRAATDESSTPLVDVHNCHIADTVDKQDFRECRRELHEIRFRSCFCTDSTRARTARIYERAKSCSILERLERSVSWQALKGGLL